MPALVPPVVPEGRLRRLAQPTLRVDELVLRPWRSSDAPAVVEAYRDPAIQRWHARSMTADEALGWVLSWADRWAAETGAGWAVDAGDVLVGRVGVGRLDLAGGLAEMAYWVLPGARRRNVASRAVRAVTAWMFDHLGLHRIELDHSTGNGASCRVATKAGYLLEGTKRQQALHADGWHDMHLHARVRDAPAASVPREQRPVSAEPDDRDQTSGAGRRPLPR